MLVGGLELVMGSLPFLVCFGLGVMGWWVEVEALMGGVGALELMW
jgi:hypothetical protein